MLENTRNKQETQAEKSPASETNTVLPEPSVISDKAAANAAAELYSAMKGGVWGLGTDEDRIYKTLKGISSPKDLQKVKDTYKDHYSADLDQHLDDELGDDHLNRAKALMKQDYATADAYALKDALSGFNTDEKAVFQTLEGKSANQKAQILKSYESLTNKPLSEKIDSRLHGFDKERATALLNSKTNEHGHNLEADAVRLKQALNYGGADKDTIVEILENRSLAEINELKKIYKAQTSTSLEESIKYSHGGTHCDRALALLKGDKALAQAAVLRNALTSVNTNEKAIYNTFDGKDAQTRKAITAAYNKTYAAKGESFDSHLRDELGDTDYNRASTLVKNGKLSDAERLYYAMEGLGTDEDTIQSVLTDKTDEQITTIKEEYKIVSNGKELVKALENDLSGRDEFRAKLDLEGKPETLAEKVNRANREAAYERWGVHPAVRSVMDVVTSKGKELDAGINKLNRAYQDAKADGNITSEESKRINQLTQYASQDVSSYTEAKDQIAETAGTVAATAGAGVAIAVTGGTATPLVVGAYAAAAGATGYVGGKSMMQGAAYDWDGAATDAAIGAVEGGVMAVSAGTAKVATEALKVTNRAAVMATEGAIDGALGGAAGGAVREGTKAETWENGVGEGLKRVGTAAAVEGVAGAVGGSMGGAVLPAAGAGLMAAGSQIKKGISQANDALNNQLNKLQLPGAPGFQPAFSGAGVGSTPGSSRFFQATDEVAPTHMRRSGSWNGGGVSSETDGRIFERSIARGLKKHAALVEGWSIADTKGGYDLFIHPEHLGIDADGVELFINASFDGLDLPFVGIQCKKSWLATNGVEEWGGAPFVENAIRHKRWVPVVVGGAPKAGFKMDDPIDATGLYSILANDGGYVAPQQFFHDRDALNAWDNIKTEMSASFGARSETDVYLQLHKSYNAYTAGQSGSLPPSTVALFDKYKSYRTEPLQQWYDAVETVKLNYKEVKELRAAIAQKEGVDFVMVDSNPDLSQPAYPFFVPSMKGLTEEAVNDFVADAATASSRPPMNVAKGTWSLPPANANGQEWYRLPLDQKKRQITAQFQIR